MMARKYPYGITEILDCSDDSEPHATVYCDDLPVFTAPTLIEAKLWVDKATKAPRDWVKKVG